MPPTTALKKTQNQTKVKKTSKSRVAEDDDLEEWKKSKQLLKPKDQLELSDAELKDIVARLLQTNDPLKPDSLVEFSYAQGEFISVPMKDNIVVVFEHQGTQIHKESDEAKQQMLEQGIDPATLDIESIAPSEITNFSSKEELLDVHETEEKKPEGEDGEDADQDGEDLQDGEGDEDKATIAEEGADEGEGEGDAVSVATTIRELPAGGKPRKLTNQFNFSERAALTYNNPTRAQETQTTPPPMATFSANILQWVIYDAYQQDYAAQQLEKELERERKEKEKAPVGKAHPTAKKGAGKPQLSKAVQGRVSECWRVLDRMVNQNTYDDIAKDYRYWEDPADEFREEEGTLLPLWKFSYDKVKKHTVTDIQWNPNYYDLFAVSFGFMDFMKPLTEGVVCLFTLKNPSFPDYICMTSSAAMSTDVHMKYPYMCLVGLYDGGVEVFNVNASCKEPSFRSNAVQNKHRGIVWQVRWAPDLPDGEMNFFSISTDGVINNWVLMQNDLQVTAMLTLYLDKSPMPGPDGTLLKTKDTASAVLFHPKKTLIYYVGTEMGFIYKCSVNYNSMYMMTFKAHNLPIYRIDFNRYNDDLFITCSADWRVKIWDDNRPEPLFVFDLGSPVGDAKFAPFSSTVFAACTNDGKVYIFDLNVNKYKPICVQAVVSKRKNKLTRLTFNKKLAGILLVGDDKGCVTTLKMSPNLRIPCKPPKKQQYLDQWTLQVMKLDRLLSLVREPPTLNVPLDTAGQEEEDN